MEPQRSSQPGIRDDRQVLTPEGHALRVIHYTDSLSGKFYEFLTNDMELSPGSPGGVVPSLLLRFERLLPPAADLKKRKEK